MIYLFITTACLLAISFTEMGPWPNTLLGLIACAAGIIFLMHHLMARKRQKLWEEVWADQEDPKALDLSLYRLLRRLFDLPKDPDHPTFKPKFTNMMLDAYRFNAGHPEQDRDVSAFHLLWGYRNAMSDQLGDSFDPTHKNIVKAYADVTAARLEDARLSGPNRSRKYLARSEPKSLDDFFDETGKMIVTNSFGKKLVGS